MSTRDNPEAKRHSVWGGLPEGGRAIFAGLVIGLLGANVWPLLLLGFGMPTAALGELAFLAIYVVWARGFLPPASTRSARRMASRATKLTHGHWIWGLPAAVAFAAVVHSAMVLLFRLTPFPAAAFHAGYNLSFIPSVPLQLAACVISALSAGVCEEIGFRGYMQHPLELRHGPVIAIAISALLFMALHLNKDWSVIGMTPIVLLAGVLLGLLAWSSGSLLFCIIGHTIMDIGLFAYWWTQILGVFHERPISQTGIDPPFVITAAVFAGMLIFTLVAVWRLREMRREK